MNNFEILQTTIEYVVHHVTMIPIMSTTKYIEESVIYNDFKIIQLLLSWYHLWYWYRDDRYNELSFPVSLISDRYTT